MRKLKEKVFSSFRFDNAVEIGRLKLPLHSTQRFDAFGSNFSPSQGFERSKESSASGPDRVSSPQKKRFSLLDFEQVQQLNTFLPSSGFLLSQQLLEVIFATSEFPEALLTNNQHQEFERQTPGIPLSSVTLHPL